MAYFADEFAAPTTVTTLTKALGLVDPIWIQFLEIRSLTGNAGTFYLGLGSLSTTAHRGTYLVAGDKFTVPMLQGRNTSTDEIRIIGTNAADKVLLTIIA